MGLLALPPKGEKLNFHAEFRYPHESGSEDRSDVFGKVGLRMDLT